ncbi:MAG: response regulator transcription factor [Anaerolineaceae bacterium]|nr:response regulator transcription factor [Anaerolineaceae bacterium]
MIRVIVCDDQDVVREGIRAILNTDPEMEVIATASDGEDCLHACHQNPPDVVLMDLKMPHMNGIQATRLIREQMPGVYVLVLTTYDADEWVFDAIRAGASGYVLKDTPKEDLVKAIQLTVEGKTVVDPSVAGKLFHQVAQSVQPIESTFAAELSERELDVLKCLARGMNNKTIAETLHLSEGTVRNYVSAIFTKLDVSDRTQAAVIALRHGLVKLN